jgi:hypothetical protein
MMIRTENGYYSKSSGAVSFLLLIFFLLSCESTGVRPSGRYEHGAFIVNEGGFGSGNGTITFRDPAGELEQNIFRNTQGDFAGDVVQSLYFDDDEGYIVVNGDSKIETFDGATFKGGTTITNAAIDKPRYMVVLDDKAYISVWGPYDESFALVDSYVLVWDLVNNEEITRIDTDEGTEELLFSGGVLLATNYNFGASNTVALIDPTNNVLLDQLEVGSGPSAMVEDANGKVWVVCIGDYATNNGSLVKIDPLTKIIEETIPLSANPSPDLAITRNRGSLLYMVGTSVFKIDITATEAPDAPIFVADDVVTPYTIAVHPGTGDIWIGDAVDYTAAGQVYIYSSGGEAVTSFAAGINPTQFVFK